MKEILQDHKKRLLLFVAAFWTFFILIIALVFLFFNLIANGQFGELPTFDELENPKSALASEVWSFDNTLLGKYYSQNRSNIKFNELPTHLVDALVATEDIRYYDHSGIDLRALTRAVVNLGKAGGASTITQQLAKNLFPRERLSKIGLVIRKLKEWIIAVRLEKCYTKEEIITMYLNTVEFSDNAFGVKSAAKTYFNKTPDSLSVSESAVLVGMLKAPFKYNPRLHPDISKMRRDVVFYQMNKYGFIDDTTLDTLTAKPIVLDYKESSHIEGLAPYFREHLRLILQKWCRENVKVDGSHYNLYKDGLKFYTTIDSRLQGIAEQAVSEHMSTLQGKFFEHWENRDPWKDFPKEFDKAVKNSVRYKSLKENGLSKDSIEIILNTPIAMKVFSWEGEKDTVMSPIDSIRYHRMFLQTGFIAIDPKTGNIKAWVGGIDYKYFQFDHIKTRRQIGSTFKPFLYATAIDNGWSPCFEVLDVPYTFEEFDNWTPQNSDGIFTGKKFTLKECLAQSKNSCSAFLIDKIKPPNVIKLVRKLGIESPIDPYPSICLGTPDISLFDMVGSYTAFANKGVYTKPMFLTRIEDKNGNVIQEFPSEKLEAMSEQTAYIMVEMLRNVVKTGTGMRVWLPKYGYNLRNDIGGKTGTTQNHSDGWFMGITPELIAGTWVGGEDRFMRFRRIDLGQGASMALPIWALFFKNLYEDETLNYDPDIIFEKPKYNLSVEIDCSKYKTTDDFQSSPDVYGSEFEN